MDDNQPTSSDNSVSMENPTYEPPQQASMQPSSLLNKQTYIGLGVLILILLVILFLVSGKKSNNGQTSQSNSSVNSQTEKPTLYPTTPASSKGFYENTVYGFQFAYPPQFTAREVSQDIISVLSTNTVPNPDAPVTGLQISITNGDNTLKNLDQAKNIFQTPVIKDTVLSGMQAKELSGNGKGVLAGKNIKFIEIYKNGHTIELSYFEGDPGFTPEILNRILTSFKFTK